MRLKTELSVQIDLEVYKLMKVSCIPRVQYPAWLENVVIVKKNRQIKEYIDFQVLNKAFPEDYYSLPTTKLLVNTTTRYPLWILYLLQSNMHDS